MERAVMGTVRDAVSVTAFLFFLIESQMIAAMSEVGNLAGNTPFQAGNPLLGKRDL